MSRFSVYCFGFGWFLLVGALWWLLAVHLAARELVLLTVLAYLGCWGGYFAASIRNRRQKAVRFVAFTASLSLALGIVEAISLSWKIDYRPIVGRPMRPWQNPINLLDPQLIHVRRPNFHVRGIIKRGNLHSLVDRGELFLPERQIFYEEYLLAYRSANKIPWCATSSPTVRFIANR